MTDGEMRPSLLGKCRGYVSSELGNLISFGERSIYHILYVNDFIFSILQPPSWFICGSFFFHKKIINSRSYNSVFQVSESVYHRANYLQFSSP